MFQSIKNWLAAFVHLQLIIMLFSLPILVLWGLSISCATLPGNLIFSPLLFIFIALCCLITLCELAGISHALLNHTLEYAAAAWYRLLGWSSPTWLTGCSLKALPVILICCAIFYLAHQRKNPSKQQQIFLILFLLTVIFVSEFFLQRNISFRVENLYVVHYKNHTVCIDAGTFSKKRSAQSWIDYTLLPEIVRQTGRPHIDTFISYKNNKRTYHAAKQLERQAGVKKILLPKRNSHVLAKKHILCLRNNFSIPQRTE
jgi:hypothetical protein